MELPSESFERAIKESKLSESAIIGRNIKWFNETYIERTKDPIEPNIKNAKVMEVGKMYSFTYHPKYHDKLDFYDYSPICIIISHVLTKDGNLNAIGLNISYMPPRFRMAILDKITKMFSTMIINNNIEKIEKEQFHSLTQLPL